MSQFIGTKKPLNAKLGGFVIWEYLKRCTESAQKVFETELWIRFSGTCASQPKLWRATHYETDHRCGHYCRK